jgi:uncharacterized protein (TIGR02246 family)
LSAGAGAAGADTKPVTAAVDQLLDAFNRHDAAKFAAAFTEDGDFIDTHGGRVHGRKAIGDVVAKLVQKPQAGNHATRGETAVKMVKPDVALVLSRLTVSNNGRPGGAFATLVLISANGKWRITACEIAPGAAPSASRK